MSSALVTALRNADPVMSVELRPPRAELDAAAGMDAWIDTYHAVKGLVRGGTFVFLTDSAVGTREEHSLRHLVSNLGATVPRDHVVPFLTTKHPLEFCLAYAERAWQEGFPSLVVLGGDRTVGPPRCVGHAWQLREAIRQHVPGLSLGGWANPHADPRQQAEYLRDDRFTGEFFLTQIVSHHDAGNVEAFLAKLDHHTVDLPGVFGVFFYRSAQPKTLKTLRQFLPVPVEGLTREFAEGLTPEAICARTIRTLRAAGVKHFYISNLPVGRARQTMEKVLELVESGQSRQAEGRS
jgi:5,10-methylenetetrahydrofolate reductase